MNINRKSEHERPLRDAEPVTLTVAGNVLEVRYMRKQAKPPPIQKLSANTGVDTRTGEFIEFQHNESRAQDKASVAQSLKRLRDIINANTENPDAALWVTLTYAENMTDSNRLYEDFRRFWQRFTYYLNKRGLPRAEYITAAEPQGRGAWHLHGLFLFPDKAPFIPNANMARIWGHGFTKTTNLKGVDNIGLYLTAYLGDMELTEAISAGALHGGRLGETKREGKAVIKGARLHLYPAGFNIYRHSRGVKMPQVYKTTERKAREIVGDAPLTYEKTIELTDEAGEVVNCINYRQYNRAATAEAQRRDNDPEQIAGAPATAENGK